MNFMEWKYKEVIENKMSTSNVFIFNIWTDKNKDRKQTYLLEKEPPRYKIYRI